MIPDSKNVMRIKKEAYSIASQTGGEIGSEHLLAGLVIVEGSVVYNLLKLHGVTFNKIQNCFHSVCLKTEPYYSTRTKRILENAQIFAEECKQTVVGSEHLFAAMLSETESIGYAILSNTVDNMGLLQADLADYLNEEKMRASGTSFEVKMSSDTLDANGLNSAIDNINKKMSFGDPFKKDNQPTNNGLLKELEGFGIDLTEKAKSGKLDPVIGRDKEIERIIQILCRRTKNNPVLIGEPGVGKSAVSEGLALAIVNDDVPDALKGKKIFSLDMASIVAGTKYRGEFEERFKAALDAVKRVGDVILFIDEIHTIVNAGGADGAVDAANILKPMLARGEIQTIGATTIDEYRKYIEKDAALERRFQPIIVDQPSVEDTILILRGLREKYEQHHKVKITDEAIEAAANLSDRYITDRFLPDKAIDLVDEASSRKRIFDKEKQSNLSIGEDDIAEIVADWTGIPVSKLTEQEGKRLLKLEDTLHQRVIGQNEAVSAVARAIKRARAGIADPRRPIGSFIFLGPTGVGKTELCKALAEAMFGDENLMIRVDMSEYMDKANVSKLIGSAPGYVGFEEGGQLTERVRRKPYSVVLFDEIEKAHPDVFNMLLQILEDGRLTDSHGRTVSFKNTIVIMTSNIGASELKKTTHLGFGGGEDDYDDVRDRQIEALKSVMKPEFINRIDEIVVFSPLEKVDIEKIADIMLKNLEKRLLEHNITLTVDERAKEYLVDKGYDKEYGARPMRRTIQRQVEDRLSEEILQNNIKENSHIKITCVDNNLEFINE